MAMKWVKKLKEQLPSLVTIAALVVVVYLLFGRAVKIPQKEVGLVAELSRLPILAAYSLLRMLGGYALSLVFSISYGYLAATSKARERFMLPVLDVLQSVPVLGFFPIAIYFFVRLFGGDRIGVEIASIFLIFTSQAWNMTFGVYESITTIPKEISRAMASFRIKGLLAFKRLIIPSSIPKLVYNSMMSWAGGWYFLIACEIIAIGPVSVRLPGLGSFLIDTASQGRYGLTLVGLAVLVAIIVSMDLLMWRPLSVWSEKFKYEMVVFEAEQRRPAILKFYARLRDSFVIKLLSQVWEAALKPMGQAIAGLAKKAKAKVGSPLSAAKIGLLVGRTLKYLSMVGLACATSYGVYLVTRSLLGPPSPKIPLIPVAVVFSFLRLLAAYGISLAWTLPLALYIVHNKRASRLLMPIAEIGASIPATALFPFIIFPILRHLKSPSFASILLLLTGMQWYLLFNLVAGASAVPDDVLEVARSFKIRGLLYYRKVLVPALFPSLITGSITAWGGGWNALIIAEFFKFKAESFSVFGIGYLLDEATYVSGDSQMMLLSVLAMVVVVTLTNRLFWRRLYDRAAERHTFE